MARALVTGGGGFIGRAVMEELRLRSVYATAMDRPADVRDAHQVSGWLAGVDTVIHLAGALGTSELFGHERDAADVNILGALTVADECHRRGIPLTWIGTGHKGQPNVYAVTKAAAEDLLLMRDDVTVVRAFHAYGPHQKAPAPHGQATVRKIIPSMVCRALTGMPIEVYGDGSNVIDLIHVDEVARVLVDAALGDPQPGVALEAGTGMPMTVREVAEQVVAMVGSDSPIVHLPMRPGEPEGAIVVAADPLSNRPFPYGMAGTIEHYRAVVAACVPSS